MPYECESCKDTGMGGWHKPMVGLDGKMTMIFVPQPCLCKRGQEILKRQSGVFYNPTVNN